MPDIDVSLANTASRDSHSDWINFYQAGQTLNRRISSVSGFFQFMRETAATEKLPITVHNPAHRDFIKRPSTDPVNETQALSATNARKLVSLPEGSSPLAARDRAILKFYVFVGPRIATGCRLEVHDFHWDEKDKHQSRPIVRGRVSPIG